MASLAKQAAANAMSAAAGAVGGVPTEDWKTTKFQTNEVPGKDWLYSCFCPLCASSSAKQNQDQSNLLFNLLCFPPPAMYSMVRINYNIKGECGDDMLWGTFCMPCLIRQAYTESVARGNVQGKFGALNDEWHFSLTQCTPMEMCMATLLPCYVASNIRRFIHPTSDKWFNMMCIVPCSMYGTVRHMYGLKSEFPHPVCEDIGVGFVCYPCALMRAQKEAPYQRTTGKVNSAIETAHKKAEEMKSSLQNAKANVMSKMS